jgi:Domain of unknown function (DUF4189)
MQLKTFIFAAFVAVAPLGGAWAEGAIAVDDEAGSKPSDAGYGIGFGDSEESAKEAALRQCRAAGNNSCTVAVWFTKCGAYASSAEKYGIGWGASEEIAKNKALDSCGNSGCRIVASECED